jgi:hypothetical protein
MSPTPRSAVAAGKRDRLVQLVPRVDATGADRFPADTDGTPISLWVSKEDIGGRELIRMNQETAPFDMVFVLPFGDAFNPNAVDVAKAFEVEYVGRRYDIVHAAEIGRRDGVELLTLSRMG